MAIRIPSRRKNESARIFSIHGKVEEKTRTEKTQRINSMEIVDQILAGNSSTIPGQAMEVNVSAITDSTSELLAIENRQYILGQTIEHEEALANEIKQMYCKITSLQRNQAMLLSQTNGILAARSLGLDKCSRVVGNGLSLNLQKCEIVPINITAKETMCGYQPYFETSTNVSFTVGKDRWTLHNFRECFWNGQYVNLNDDTYSFVKGEWVKQEPTVHLQKLQLISRFENLPIHTYDFLPRHHSMYETSNMEQMNILSEIISRVQESNANSLSDIVMDSRGKNNRWDMTSWISIFKYGALVVFSIISGIASMWILIAIIPCHKIASIFQKKSTRNNLAFASQGISMLPVNVTDDHSATVYLPGKGLFWKNCMCLIKAEVPV